MVPARRVRSFGCNPQGPADGLEDFLFRGVMKRRQPGTLTGMPFMANLADQTFVDDMGRRADLTKPSRRGVFPAPSGSRVPCTEGRGRAGGGVTRSVRHPSPGK